MHREAVDRERDKLIPGGTKVATKGEVESNLIDLFDANESKKVEDIIAIVDDFVEVKFEKLDEVNEDICGESLFENSINKGPLISDLESLLGNEKIGSFDCFTNAVLDERNGTAAMLCLSKGTETVKIYEGGTVERRKKVRTAKEELRNFGAHRVLVASLPLFSGIPSSIRWHHYPDKKIYKYAHNKICLWPNKDASL
ncbi:hypothetical protein SUGI_0418530 [Cryptomeria japonica]|nr:hypothetical protein SUGI_0418530 [Cryptomeria japonica]